MNRYTMKTLPGSEQPYEKMEEKGSKHLSDAELVAVIIKSGTRNMKSVDIASSILDSSKHGLLGLHQMSLDELQAFEGIGRVKAIQLKAVAELAIRLSKASYDRHVTITSPKKAAAVYMEEMRHLQKEHFKVILLDTKNNILCDSDLTIGTVNASLINPREVFVYALKKQGVRVLLMHNHPSGDPKPSSEDILVTRRIAAAGKLLGIEVLDHIIIGDGHYISLKEEGYIDESQ